MAYKTDLINHVQTILGGTKKDAEQAVNAVLTAIQDVTIQEGKLLIRDHGSYEIRPQKARKGFDPLTKQPRTIDAYNRITFKAGKGFKNAANV